VGFTVYFFFTFFSDFRHRSVVVAEVASAVATLGKRGEVVNLDRNHCVNVCNRFRLGLTRGDGSRSIGLAVRHRHKGHRLELAHLQNRNLVLHGHTMG